MLTNKVTYCVHNSPISMVLGLRSVALNGAGALLRVSFPRSQ